MSPEEDRIANKACLRCRKHKRKCDRGLPKCSLCSRLRQICKYEATFPSSPSITSPDPSQELQISPHHIKAAIVQRLASLKPSDVATKYFHNVEPWFPIISKTRLCHQLPSTWDDATIDFACLSFSIVLLSHLPRPRLEVDDLANDFKSLYLCAKNWIALIEGVGINSLDIMQSRLLVTLFEVAHGLYPAAYISIGATVRAADALIVLGEDLRWTASASEHHTEERVMAWTGMVILDRYIAITINNGKSPPLTRGQTCPAMAPSITSSDSTAASPSLREFVRLFETSNLVDKVHTTLHEPTAQHSFNMEEVMLIVNTLNSLKTVLHQDIPEKSKIYASSLSICLAGLLLAFENGSKAFIDGEDTTECRIIADASLDGLIEVICKMVEPLTTGQATIDANILPPFTSFLLYKTATVVTEKVRMGDTTINSLQRLKSLRDTLTLISQRWLCGERYLNLLDEDTTPRMLKALEAL